MPIINLLGYLGRQGRFVLIAGLVVAVLFPGLAQIIKGWLPQFIALLLFFGAFRIGPVDAIGQLSDINRSVLTVLILQLVLPCALALIFRISGLTGPLITSLILMASASSIAGSPNLTVLTGFNPAPALRLLVVGTALLPLTVIPVFFVFPLTPGFATVYDASFNLLLLIVGATLIAFLLRYFLFRNPSKESIEAFDGISALLMATVVIGLMSELTSSIFTRPLAVLFTMCLAFVANFGMQFATYFILGQKTQIDIRVSNSIVAGNRNMAIFLTALPASVTDPLLLFVACYQVPMYLTPVFLRPFYFQSKLTNESK